MRFLYGIKNCSACSKRETCNLKNDPKTLVPKVQVFEHVNRSTLRIHSHDYHVCDRRGNLHKRERVASPKPPHIKIQSFCKHFTPEEKGTYKAEFHPKRGEKDEEKKS